MVDLLIEHTQKVYCIVFIEDIHIYSKDDEDHEHHVKAVKDTIRKAGFRLHGSNCSFSRTSASFLGFDISGDDPDEASIRMKHEEGKAIADWPCLKSPNDMRSFVGLAGVYRKFVPDFAKISAPLMELLTADQQEFDAFKVDASRWKRVTTAIDLEAAVITRPALALPQRNNYNYLVRTDASDFAIGAALRQLQLPEEGTEPQDRIIAYFSRMLHDAETRHSTYDKELLGVRDAIEHWKYYLKSGHKFLVQTDHTAL